MYKAQNPQFHNPTLRKKFYPFKGVDRFVGEISCQTKDNTIIFKHWSIVSLKNVKEFQHFYGKQEVLALLFYQCWIF